jgi:glycosyltransferase involved in cell wall biosynthesis
MNQLISVCLATYNGEKYLKEQLDSIKKQTYKNFELIVQDDLSKDKTLEILQNYEGLNIQVYKNKKNMGYIKNFESLLKKANGEYIAICDQDDVWELDKLEILINNIKENSLIYSDSLLIDGYGNSLDKTLSQKLKNNFIDSYSALNFLYDNSVSAHAMLFKKELLQHIFPFPNVTYFDAWIAANAANTGSVKYINKTLVMYRQHSTNTLGNVKKTKKKITKTIQNKVQKKEQNVKNTSEKIKEFVKISSLKKDDLKLLLTLQKYYEGFDKRWFSFKMFVFLYKNKEKLFPITTKNKFSLILKKAIGKKLYKVAPFL